MSQEVEPTIGEALCRLFPPDENIDLSRIAKIAKQSLKRRDSSGATGKTTIASRSASNVSPAPPAVTESSSSRSDMLLLGLSSDDRTLRRGSDHAAAARGAVCATAGLISVTFSAASVALANALPKKLGCAEFASRTFRFLCGTLESKIRVLAAVLRTLQRTFWLNLAGGLLRHVDCEWGGRVNRTAAPSGLRDFLRFFDQPTSWSEDLPSKIPRRTFLPSWTLRSVVWTLLTPAVGAHFIPSHHDNVIY